MVQPRSVDAIIVPTARPGKRTGQSARLAGTLGCPLVVLCSGSAMARDVVTSDPGELSDFIAVDFGAAAHAKAFPFESTELLSGTSFAREGDVSAKRNAALVLAHYVGWRRIIFLDDDISVAVPGDLRRAARLLDRYAAVGLAIVGFPDGSVATHAYRQIGGTENKFLAAGALALEPASRRSFFPQIYNEEWLYLIDDTGLPPLAITGHAHQQPYDPFADPRRATSEEFGEVIAIGLYSLASAGRLLRDADDEYWRSFLRQREALLADLLRMVRASETIARRQAVIAALLASRETLAQISPALCSAYVGAWLRDRDRWASYLCQLPTDLLVPAALAELGLGSSPVRT